MSRPSVTVLMSVYNGECWLDCSIRSILEQTFTDFEFLVVNGGSTDSNFAFVEKWASIDERLVIIDKPKTGLTDSRNCGIQKAKGGWVARQDADDVSEPGRLFKQRQAAQSMPAVVLTGSAFALINVEGREGKQY